MRKFKIDWLSGSDFLKLSEIVDGMPKMIRTSTRKDIAAKLLYEVTGSRELSKSMAEEFASEWLNGHTHSFPSIWDTNQVFRWIEEVLVAKI